MKIIYDKDLSEKTKKENDRLIKADEKNWETGDYGRNKKYMQRASSEDEKKLNAMITASKKNKPLLRLRHLQWLRKKSFRHSATLWQPMAYPEM